MATEVPKISDEKLNAAAKMLIDQLPDHVGELVEVLTEEYQLPLWHLVDGILLEVHSEGRLSAFTIDPAWREALKQKMLRCQYEDCGKLFQPKWIGQLYCSNACGNAAAGKFIVKAQKTEMTPLPGGKKDADKPTTEQPGDAGSLVVSTDSDPADSADPIDIEEQAVAEKVLGPKSDWGSTMVQGLDDD